MDKRPKTILYLSDDSDNDYEEPEETKTEELPEPIEEAKIEPEICKGLRDTRTPELNEGKVYDFTENQVIKINGRKVIKKEHMKEPTPNSLICKHCKRVYIQKHTFEKHENEKCPVLLDKKKQQAELILKENERILAKAKRREYLNKVKEERELHRPITEVVVKKRTGPKPKPEVVILRDTRIPELRQNTSALRNEEKVYNAPPPPPKPAFNFRIG